MDTLASRMTTSLKWHSNAVFINRTAGKGIRILGKASAANGRVHAQSEHVDGTELNKRKKFGGK